MSSPLEGRIRALAREEANALLGVATPAPVCSADVERVAALEEQIAELRTRLDAVEKTAGLPDPKTSAVRRTRKAAEAE